MARLILRKSTGNESSITAMLAIVSAGIIPAHSAWLRGSYLPVSVEVSSRNLQSDSVLGFLVQFLGDEARLLHQQVGLYDLFPKLPQTPRQHRLPVVAHIEGIDTHVRAIPPPLLSLRS